MKKILIIILACSFIASCKKETEEFEQVRLFRPVVSGQLSADSNTIVAAWVDIADATSYELQLSRDTFRTIDQTIKLDTNVAVVTKLLFNQLYQLQVRAMAPDSIYNSKWGTLGAIKTLSSILKTPGPEDITTNAVRVRWTTKGAPVTSVKIRKTSDSSQVAEEALTPADVTNEYKVVDGLAPETQYTIYLYSGADERGYVNFTTKSPGSGSIIDLTGITGRPSVLADTLPLVPSGSTILLKRGELYTISAAINLSKSVVIMSDADLTVTSKAKIFFTSNFNFTAGAAIDSLEFNDVHMYSDNYGSRYVFNTTNSANVGKIKFTNSLVEIFRGVMRLQSGTTVVSNFIVDNSIIDSISGYGVVTVGVATCQVGNFSITNSTVYKAEKLIASSTGSTSVLIDNCTFNEIPNGNNTYFIDFGSTNVTNGITINNSIFGIGKIVGTTVSVRGYRAGSATPMYTSNIYRTSDYVSGGNDFPNIITYSRPSTQLWQNPYAGNFTIADATFPGRTNCGDPRWRP